MKNFILKSITGLAIIMLILALGTIENFSVAHIIIIALSLSWLGLFTYVNNDLII